MVDNNDLSLQYSTDWRGTTDQNTTFHSISFSFSNLMHTHQKSRTKLESTSQNAWKKCWNEMDEIRLMFNVLLKNPDPGRFVRLSQLCFGYLYLFKSFFCRSMTRTLTRRDLPTWTWVPGLGTKCPEISDTQRYESQSWSSVLLRKGQELMIIISMVEIFHIFWLNLSGKNSFIFRPSTQFMINCCFLSSSWHRTRISLIFSLKASNDRNISCW